MVSNGKMKQLDFSFRMFSIKMKKKKSPQKRPQPPHQSSYEWRVFINLTPLKLNQKIFLSAINIWSISTLVIFLISFFFFLVQKSDRKYFCVLHFLINFTKKKVFNFFPPCFLCTKIFLFVSSLIRYIENRIVLSSKYKKIYFKFLSLKYLSTRIRFHVMDLFDHLQSTLFFMW